MVGKLIYKYFFKPLGPIRDAGGVISFLKVKIGFYSMKRKSYYLKVSDFGVLDETTTICGVAGKKNWYQMVFCLYSFFKQTKKNFPVVIIDDGTLDETFITEVIKVQIPFVKVILKHEASHKASIFLERNQFTLSKSIFDKYVVFKKVFEARICIEGPVVVFDADMLFFKKPVELLTWMEKPNGGIYMNDKFTLYGPQTNLLLTNSLVLPKVNTGIVGLNNIELDWKIIEEGVSWYLKKDFISYLTEQGLYAYYFKQTDAQALDSNSYIILPTENEVKKSLGVMHHYPTENRTFYFRYGWRKVLKN